MRLRQRLWNPYVLVFLTSGCIMTIELVASRLIAPRLGVSLYTWTSIIGVILAGISIGNYIGGRLADRYASLPFLGLILGLASFGTLGILFLTDALIGIEIRDSLPLMVQIVGYIAGVYLLPSAILGCVSPIVVKLSLTDLARAGTTVGKVYAWSSVGSIAGTFATGFWFISWFGTRTIIMLVAAMLMVLALWFVTAGEWRRAMARALVLVVLFALSWWLLQRNGDLVSDCLVETDYFCIKVHKEKVAGREVRSLVLDRLVHSYSDIQDPTYLQYGYERTYAQVIEPMMRAKPDLDVFFIGGGGYTFPRYLEAMLPQSHLVVAEIDPMVTEVAHEHLGLRRDTQIETKNLDARAYMAWYGEPNSFDIVFGDAFNDYSVPFHLTTLECAQRIAELLREDGLYVANIIDGGRHGHFLRAFVRTLRQAFPEVLVIPNDHNNWRTSVRSTFVIVASKKPLDVSAMRLEQRPLTPEELEGYLALEPPMVLTDNHVPVDNLLAPVFEDSA
ncbi:MAG: fused MFS/spermidine synthase [Chloroflexi bacterium]|nr:fused MFS/spermidine synthase [Chloroflexota bacterium]